MPVDIKTLNARKLRIPFATLDYILKYSNNFMKYANKSVYLCMKYAQIYKFVKIFLILKNEDEEVFRRNILDFKRTNEKSWIPYLFLGNKESLIELSGHGIHICHKVMKCYLSLNM